MMTREVSITVTVQIYDLCLVEFSLLDYTKEICILTRIKSAATQNQGKFTRGCLIHMSSMYYSCIKSN